MNKLLTDIINLPWTTTADIENSDISIKQNLLSIFDKMLSTKLNNGQSYLSEQELFMIIVWDMLNNKWSKEVLFYSKKAKEELSGISTYLLFEETGFIPGTVSTIFKYINKFPRFILNFSLSESGFTFVKDSESSHIFNISLSEEFTSLYHEFLYELNKIGIDANPGNVSLISEEISSNLFRVEKYDQEFIKKCNKFQNQIDAFFNEKYLKFFPKQKTLNDLIREIADSNFKNNIKNHNIIYINFFKTLINIAGYLGKNKILRYDFSSSGSKLDIGDDKNLQSDGGAIVTLENNSNNSKPNDLYLLANIIFSKSSSAQRALFDYEKRKIIEKVSSISILVDSFAHNIAAHSLSAISTLFERRNYLLQTPFKALNNPALNENFNTDENLNDIIKNNINLRKKIFTIKENEVKYVKIPIPLDGVITKFLNYINDKSEFWSGVISGETYGGSIISLFALLYEFIDNPLFIGTIVKSERITKVKFEINNSDFALVDFSIINDADNVSGNFKFVEELNCFSALKTKLEEIKIFIPGDNVGKHSLFTVFENVLRNIKHSNYENLSEAIFCLNIKLIDNKFCELTAFLKHELPDIKDLNEIVENANKSFDKGVVEGKTNEPIMGGNSQCLLCAKHLYSENFYKDFEINKHYLTAVSVETKYFALSFKLWIGQEIIDITNNTDDNEEKFSGFKFIVSNEQLGEFMGTARSLTKDEINSNETVVYKKWLNKFIYNYKGIKIIDWDLRDNVGNLINYGNGSAEFNFVHSPIEEGKLYVREHGIWRKKLKDNFKFYEDDIAEALLCGVVIFDNRISNIWERPNKINIERELKLFIRKESENQLEIDNMFKLSLNEITINRHINFLIIHLSFVQKIFNEKYKNSNFNNFIDDIYKAVNGRQTFRLIITTGRGRTDWKTIVKDSKYKHLIAHKSPNSLKNAILQGVLKNDDFEIKYKLVKAIFGS